MRTLLILLFILVLAVIAASVLCINAGRKKTQPSNTGVKEEESPSASAPASQISDSDFQIRFAVEHTILPSRIASEPIYMITSIIAERGAFINNYYRDIYAQNKQLSPYALEDFVVSVPYEVSSARVVRIDMPEKNLKNTLCKRIYIVFNESFTKHLFVSVEYFDEQLKMCITADGEHEQISDIADNEEELLKQIIEDEDIAEENYSDALQTLMKDQKTSEPLLEDAEQIRRHAAEFTQALVKVHNMKLDNKREDALKLLKDIIRKEASKYRDNDITEYRCFRNSFEVLLYANLYHPYNPEKQEKKQLVGMQVDLSAAYMLWGVMMLEQRQYDKAIDILRAALKANPVNVSVMFALADAYKGKNYLKSYLSVISQAHSCAVRKSDIAQIYRCYAYYYTKINDFDTAFSLIYASKHFDIKGFGTALRETEKISQQSFPEPPVEEIKQRLMQKNISWGAKNLAVSVVNLLDKEYTQSQNAQGLKMCAELKKELSFEN